MSNPDLNRFVNLHAYPIDQLDSEAGQEPLNRAHRMMKEDTLVEFPDFLRSQAVVALAEELNALESNAHQIDYMSTPYGWMDNSEFPPNHPRSALFRRNCGTITTELFAEGSLSNRLFHVDELTEFVRQMLGYETLYRSACPTLSIQVNVMDEGDRFDWHFDTNDGVVSFMIQNADTGVPLSTFHSSVMKTMRITIRCLMYLTDHMSLAVKSRAREHCCCFLGGVLYIE